MPPTLTIHYGSATYTANPALAHLQQQPRPAAVATTTVSPVPVSPVSPSPASSSASPSPSDAVGTVLAGSTQAVRLESQLTTKRVHGSFSPELLILDEPTRGLNVDDTVTVFAALAKLAHSGDPKHCIIVLTASREIAEAADQMFEI